jgi:glycosyltransferase involved in cell wall biosynthesis
MIPVLYMIEHLKQGGSERYVSELARSSREFGVEPHVCVFSEGGIFYEEIRKAGIPLFVAPIKTLYHPSTLGHLLDLSRYLRERGIRVLHSFQPNANILGTLAAKAVGLPVIVSRRSLGDFGSLGSPRLEWIQKKLTNRLASRFLANSRAVLSASSSRESLSPERFVLIYNGLDTDRFAPVQNREIFRKELNLLPDDFVFGISSGLRPVKGVDVAIRGFARIAKKKPRALLLIAGDGTERQKLEDLVRELGVEERVRFLGTRPDMERLYPAMDVFVLTSHSEGFSNALLEAMGMGLPVLATAVGGNIEMVTDGESGFLVPVGDDQALSEHMSFLFDHPEKVTEMGQAGRSWVERTNTRPGIYRQFAELYRELSDVR